ncbi:hypothetical protein [Streptomyces sp. NPDC048612]|uniref:hypothetical protein n=1 Tax=Streptomyces sp. NPDC048612 TaxID=3365579 RepID=UPI003716D6C8
MHELRQFVVVLEHVVLLVVLVLGCRSLDCSAALASPSWPRQGPGPVEPGPRPRKG